MGLFSKTLMEVAVNHHQRKVLHAIFAHPVNANLDLNDVTNVLTGLGAEIDAKAKSWIGVKLNGRSAILHLTNHSLLKAEVMQIRKFLEVLAGSRPRRSRSNARSPSSRAAAALSGHTQAIDELAVQVCARGGGAAAG